MKNNRILMLLLCTSISLSLTPSEKSQQEEQTGQCQTDQQPSGHTRLHKHGRLETVLVVTGIVVGLGGFLWSKCHTPAKDSSASKGIAHPNQKTDTFVKGGLGLAGLCSLYSLYSIKHNRASNLVPLSRKEVLLHCSNHFKRSNDGSTPDSDFFKHDGYYGERIR